MAKAMVPEPTRVLRSRVKPPAKPTTVREPKVIRKRAPKVVPKTSKPVRDSVAQERHTQEQEKPEVTDIANQIQEIELEDQEIKERESFEMVQVLLLVTFATICYLRDLLPVGSFEKRELPAIRQAFRRTPAVATGKESSSKAPSGTLGSGEIGRNQKPGRMRILARGQTTSADKILLWLDGIFEALGRGVLDAIQLSIITERDKPSNVIESYTFTFSYASKSKEGNKHLAGVVFSGSNGEAVTMKGALAELGELRRHLTNVCETLPRLPVTRFLTLHLSYNNECPINYQPPGFLPAEASTMCVPDNDLWKMSRCWGGQMNSGYHEVRVVVCHLSMTRGGDADDEDIRIPSKMQCTKVMDRFGQRKETSSINAADAAPFEQRSQTMRTKPSQEPEPLPARLDGDNAVVRKTADQPRFDRDRTPNLTASRAAKFNAMIKSPSLRDSLVPTQPLKWKLEFRKEGKLHRKRAANVQMNGLLPIGEVSCHCGFGGEEGEMVTCGCCDKRQHCHCYGLPNDQATMVHVCYDCLLDDTEGGLLDRLEQLVQMRRTVWFVLKPGFPPLQSELAKTLHYNYQQTVSIIARLKKYGLIVDVPGSHTRGYSSKDLPKYKVVEGAIRKSYQPGGLLHFLSLISHHYELQDSFYSDSPPQSPQQIQRADRLQSNLEVRHREMWSADTGTEDLSDIAQHSPSALRQEMLQIAGPRMSSRPSEPSPPSVRQKHTVTAQRGQKRGLPMDEPVMQKCVKRARSPLDVSEET